MVLPDADTGPDSAGSPLQSPGSWILLARWSDADTGPDSVGSPLQSPGSWILLARWCGVYSWRIDGLWALPRHIKKWGSTTSHCHERLQRVENRIYNLFLPHVDELRTQVIYRTHSWPRGPP